MYSIYIFCAWFLLCVVMSVWLFCRGKFWMAGVITISLAVIPAVTETIIYQQIPKVRVDLGTSTMVAMPSKNGVSGYFILEVDLGGVPPEYFFTLRSEDKELQHTAVNVDRTVRVVEDDSLHDQGFDHRECDILQPHFWLNRFWPNSSGCQVVYNSFHIPRGSLVNFLNVKAR